MHAQLAVHAVDLAMSSFADVRSSLETVQAFFVLSTWKDIDDCSSHLRFGFASQLCRDLELSTLAPMEKDMTAERLSWWRARQRMSLAIFIRVRRSRSYLAQLFGRRTLNLIFVSSSSTGPDSWQSAGMDAFVAAARSSHLVVVRSLDPRHSTRTSLLPFGSGALTSAFPSPFTEQPGIRNLARGLRTSCSLRRFKYDGSRRPTSTSSPSSARLLAQVTFRTASRWRDAVIAE